MKIRQFLPIAALSNNFHSYPIHSIYCLKEFIDLYYQSTYGAIVKLTRLKDKAALEMLTRLVLEDVWSQHEAFAATTAQGTFIFKVMVKHIFAFLRQRNEKERIDFLQKTLLIHPQHYLGE